MAYHREEGRNTRTNIQFINELFEVGFTALDEGAFGDTSDSRYTDRRNELYSYLRNGYGIRMKTDVLEADSSVTETTFNIILAHYRRYYTTYLHPYRYTSHYERYPLRDIDFPHTPCSIQADITEMINDYDLCEAIPPRQNFEPPNYDNNQYTGNDEVCVNLQEVCKTNCFCVDSDSRDEYCSLDIPAALNCPSSSGTSR